jgi:hypothetical protein
MRLLYLLQLFVQQSGLFQFHCQIFASELEAPIESDGEGEEGNDCQRLQIIAQRQLVTF